MAVRQNLFQHFVSYLNDREKYDVTLLNKVNDEANRVLPNFINNQGLDDEGLHLYLINYIDDLRHNIFDRYGAPSWGISHRHLLIPHYAPMNIAPPPPVYNIAPPPPVYNNPPYVPPLDLTTTEKYTPRHDELYPWEKRDFGQGKLYKNTRRRPRRGKRVKARRSKKY